MKRERSWAGALAIMSTIALSALVGSRAMALSVKNTNFVDLLSEANAIVVGRVEAVTDGLDGRGIPYTEIRLDVSESIRGNISGSYTFRQFGLTNPRLSSDGTRKLMPGPTGFPQYAVGEQVVLFLRPAAAWTGFRMPVGVSQGKFNLGPGRAENDMGNAGLFHNVRLDKRSQNDETHRMMTSTGAVNPDAFLSFVRRAVHERWVETGRMSRADERGHPRNPPQPDRADSRVQPGAEPSPAPAAKNESIDPNANNALGRTGR